jgi:serine protease Do
LAAPAKSSPKEPASPAFAIPAALKPAPARRQELPAAFSKPVPTSLADLRAIEQQVKKLVPQVSPAVVAVEVGYGSGSGVVISADGLVLSAGHVCGRPHRDVLFTFPDGKTARGKTMGVDREADTGLMRITDPGPWPYVAVGDLEDARLGDWVLALGHPGGFDLKRSLVVRLGRIIRAAPGIVQTDCTIYPGDSGGPLFDMHGRVLAIHSAISSSLAENFHVPITEFFDTWDALATGGSGDTLASRPRAYVGASAADDPAGCRLSAVETNGPAFNAGLKPGDLVLKVEGRDILVSAVFRRWIAEARPGETLNLEIKRGDKLLSLQVKLQTPPDGK